MIRIAVLRCEKLPSFVDWEVPNLDELFEEDNLLVRGFRSLGFDAEPVVWNRPDIDWDTFDIALIRSTWDYLDERERFLQVLSQIEASSCTLFNPLDAVRWNIDKHYFFDLEKWGVPIIPTLRASTVDRYAFQERFPGLESVILKPAIGLGAAHSYRVSLDDLDETLLSLRTSQSDREYLVQPFIESVVHEGEWSFIYFSGELSHILLKKPAPNDYRVQGIYGGTVQTVSASPQDRRQADAVLAKLPFEILYARLDFVRVGDELSVIEVELIEPIFSFHLVPDSITRLVEATRAKFEM